LGGEIILDIQEIVFEVISHELPRLSGAFSLETSLEDLGIDSLKAITILFELEDRFNIEIPNEIFDSIQNVNDIVQELQKLTNDTNIACPAR
jgi:acyl carrier protein